MFFLDFAVDFFKKIVAAKGCTICIFFCVPFGTAKKNDKDNDKFLHLEGLQKQQQ
jgi:hypothetical protein